MIPVSASVRLGPLAPHDVRVELYAGRVNARQEIVQGESTELHHSNSDGDDHTFTGSYRCSTPGSYGYTLRVLPDHPDLRNPLEMGLVRWAQ